MPETQLQIDERWMRRAIRLAMNGRGEVEPNPMVGCVIVKGDRIIGEGFHRKYGAAHAEPTALRACSESPAGATAYVTLEPCCHLDKKTPPCVPALIDAKLARVVAGSVDPNPSVNGKGLEQLAAAGIATQCNVLEAEAKQLLAPFLAREVYDRPYVTLKWEETADGKVAGPRGTRLQITGERASTLVHQLRAKSDAIIVGINTVIIDDPLLTARGVASARPSLRIVLDHDLRLALESKLVQTAREVPTLLYCASQPHSDSQHVQQLTDAGIGLLFGNERERPDALPALLEFLALTRPEQHESPLKNPVAHVLVEPGPTLAAAFFRSGAIDRVWLFRSNVRVNDATAPNGPGIPGDYLQSGEMLLEGDSLTEYLNPTSPVFFAVTPSADLVLAREAHPVS